MRNSRVIRKFERFLFKGIPEQPEPMWERDDNSNVSIRHTGKPQATSIDNDILSHAQVIGEFTYNSEDNSDKYESYIK